MKKKLKQFAASLDKWTVIALAIFGLGCFSAGKSKEQYNPNTQCFTQTAVVDGKTMLMVSTDSEHWFAVIEIK